MDIIQVKSITVNFGKITILDNISFSIKEREIFGIIGMSGSGKTTLLTTLIGFIVPAKGELLFKSIKTGQMKPMLSNLTEVRRTFGFAAQLPSFYPELTVRENLEYFGSLYDLSREVKNNNISALIELTELRSCENVLSSKLSGGMQKRLDIACALIHNPPVLILDEPTADLDPILRKELWDLMKKINRTGTTIIIASHFLHEIETLCTRIGIINDKHLVKLGTADELKSLYSKNKEIHLETVNGRYDLIIEKLKKIKVIEITHMTDHGHKLVISTPEAEEVLKHLLLAVSESKDIILNIGVDKPSLSQIFESIVKKGLR